MRLSRLLTVLALLGFSLACSGLGGEEVTEPPVTAPPENTEPYGHEPDVPDPVPTQSDWDRFAESRYDYCDATVLAGMWGDVGVSEAKDAIGRFLIDGEGDLLESKLGWARQHALDNFSNRNLRCNYHQIGFTYDDAEALASLWGIEAWEAKMRIEEKYLRDGHSDSSIRSVLREAYQSDGLPEPIEAYSSSEFEYCDALVLAGLWNTNTYEAKLKIGVLINAGDVGSISSVLSSAQLAAANNMQDASQRCDYSEIGYTYDDADILATLWGIDTWDAKIRIEEKYLRDGHVRTHIDAQLRRARRLRQ